MASTEAGGESGGGRGGIGATDAALATAAPGAAADAAAGVGSSVDVVAEAARLSRDERLLLPASPGPGTKNSWIPIPTVRFAVILAVLGFSVALLPNGLGALVLVLFLLMWLVFVADFFLAPKPSAVGMQRVLPDVLVAHHEDEVRWHLSNPTNRPTRLGVADELPPSFNAQTRRFWLKLGARGVGEAASVIAPSRRGRFVVSEVTIRAVGPFGLAARQGRRELESLLRVHPPFRSKADAELKIAQSRVSEVGLRNARGAGGATEFEQLREFNNDDEFRRIDWAATARAGNPIVRTYRAEQNQNIVVLLDNGRVMAGRVDSVPRVEHAMDAVMMLTAVSTRLGDKCGLVAFDREIRSVVPPRNQRSQLSAVTEAMYDLEPELTDSDYATAFSQVVGRFRRRMLLVVLTDLVEQAVGESLIPALPLIIKRHVVIVGAVQDPAVVRWSEEPALDASEVHRKAAAVTNLEERARAAARLRALGATVVDAPPGKLSPALADAYLQAKSKGRI